MPQLGLTTQLLLIFWIANQVLSALIQALPEPTTNSNPFYVFIYKFLSLLIADFKSFSQHIPPPTVTVVRGQVSETTTTEPTALKGNQ